MPLNKAILKKERPLTQMLKSHHVEDNIKQESIKESDNDSEQIGDDEEEGEIIEDDVDEESDYLNIETQ